METNISIAGLSLLGAGILNDGALYGAVLLNQEHVDAVAALHAQTIAGLGPDEKTFMLPKSRDYFAAHLQKGAGNAILGIVSEGKLVAQAVIRHPTAADPADGMVDMHLIYRPPPGRSLLRKAFDWLEHRAGPEDETVMQAVSVAPGYRGRQLINVMIGHWLEHAKAHGRTQAFAEVDVRNIASWSGFIKGGLNLESMGRDPADGTPVYNVYAPVRTALKNRLTPVFNEKSWLPDHIKRRQCSSGNLEEQEKLFRDGYLCVAYNRQAHLMTFVQYFDRQYWHGNGLAFYSPR